MARKATKTDDRVRAAHGVKPKTETLAQLRRRLEAEDEALWLGASPIACRVSDAWALAGGPDRSPTIKRLREQWPELSAALDAIEDASRPSAMRKVR